MPRSVAKQTLTTVRQAGASSGKPGTLGGVKATPVLTPDRGLRSTSDNTPEARQRARDHANQYAPIDAKHT